MVHPPVATRITISEELFSGQGDKATASAEMNGSDEEASADIDREKIAYDFIREREEYIPSVLEVAGRGGGGGCSCIVFFF